MFPGLLHSCHLIDMMFVLTLLALVTLTHVHCCKSELRIETARERKDGLSSAEPALPGRFTCVQSWCVLSSPPPIFPRLSFDRVDFRKHGCVLTTAVNFNFLVPYIRRRLCHGKSLGLSLCLSFST